MTFYDVLGIPPQATAETVKLAYRTAAKQAHPDLPGGSADAFREVTSAWAVLGDPAARQGYDERLRLQREAREAAPGETVPRRRDPEKPAAKAADGFSSTWLAAVATAIWVRLGERPVRAREHLRGLSRQPWRVVVAGLGLAAAVTADVLTARMTRTVYPAGVEILVLHQVILAGAYLLRRARGKGSVRVPVMVTLGGLGAGVLATMVMYTLASPIAWFPAALVLLTLLFWACVGAAGQVSR